MDETAQDDAAQTFEEARKDASRERIDRFGGSMSSIEAEKKTDMVDVDEPRNHTPWIPMMRVLILDKYGMNVNMEDDGSVLVAVGDGWKWRLSRVDDGIHVEHGRWGTYLVDVDTTISDERIRELFEAITSWESKADEAAKRRAAIDREADDYEAHRIADFQDQGRPKRGSGSRDWGVLRDRLLFLLPDCGYDILRLELHDNDGERRFKFVCDGGWADDDQVTVLLEGDMRHVRRISAVRRVRRSENGIMFEMRAEASGMWGRFVNPVDWLDKFFYRHLDAPLLEFQHVWKGRIWKTHWEVR